MVTLTDIMADALPRRKYAKWHNQRKEFRMLVNNNGDAGRMLALMESIKRNEDWFLDILGVNICALAMGV